ncbi:serine/threonine-protein kinase [Streptomyces longispororuber]|uniref:serine/threonine-protein kinase n=1 Tax=Streptomyces longispororuber TaxID=68230 RepID=UPI0021091886|nr:serine/threonine-protein kinase [Streptomyces longispororuber]MCQ4214373.1 serine/threonine protein kinase [Streptomyces longispororuber]
MQPLQADEPTTVGPYRLLGRLGHGGMGRVYLGRSAGGRTVAVKVVHPHFALDEEFRARFRREVAAARRVGGAWTAPVLDADPEAAVPWVATGYVAGPSLAQAAGDGSALPEHSVRVLGAGLAEALAAVHGLGLVHRDVKPSNVLLTVDGPRLIDFGIARATDGTASLTSTGVSIGSPGYMSPEQILGKGVTGAADVFSLGAVLVYAATGESPFPGDSSAALLYKVVHEQPELGSLTGELRDVAAACLAKDAAARPTPQEVAGRLAPEGAARLVAAGWLPGALVEQVSRSAVQLLDLEGTPADAVAPSGPVGFSSPSVTGGPEPAGVFGPPDPAYAPVPVQRSEPPAPPATPTPSPTRAPQDARPGRLSVSVSATSSPQSPDGRGRRVSCSVALAVAGALAAVTVGGIFVVNMLPGGGSDSGNDGSAGGTRPAASASASPSASAPTGASVPQFYVGAWRGQGTATGLGQDLPAGTFDIVVRQAAPGQPLGTVTQTDALGGVCVDVLTLKSATADELVATGRGKKGGEAQCLQGAHPVHLRRDGKALRFTSDDPRAGNPRARLVRVD